MSLITRPSTDSSPLVSTRDIGAPAEPSLLRIENACGLSVDLYPSGVIASIQHDGIMINHALGDALRGGIGRLCLRRRTATGIEWAILTGPASASSFGAKGAEAIWSGRWQGIGYRCVLALHPDEPDWCWQVTLDHADASNDDEYDVLLVQDLGLAPMDAALINESYLSQYLDHQIHHHDSMGVVLMTRQNRPQLEGRHPWLAQTCLPGVAGCLTDGHDFFGTGHRSTSIPNAMASPEIATRVRQHEFACSTIQGQPQALDSQGKATWRFISRYQPDHPSPSAYKDTNCLDAVSDWAASSDFGRDLSTARLDRHRLDRMEVVSGDELEEVAMKSHFPGAWRHIEKDSRGRLLSFFRETDGHVVTSAKEHLTERPHGQILRTGSSPLPDDNSLCATSWMHGAFLSHVALGNTVFHKFLPVARNALDATAAGGLRIAVELDGQWFRLAVPSAMEIRRSSVLWCYAVGERVIWITVEASVASPEIDLAVHVDGEPLRLMVHGRVLVGDAEPRAAGRMEVDASSGRITLLPNEESTWGQKAPEARLDLQVDEPGKMDAIGGDELLFADGRSRGYPWMVMRTQPLTTFGLRLSTGQQAQEDLATGAFWSSFDLDRSLDHDEPAVERIEDAMRWFTHNAIVHLAAPHGLEQFTGGAWGTRDVCQGPLEFLLAAKRNGEARKILTMLFSDQRSDGGWPQWFMVDAYRSIRQADSHGDVIVWPLKALASYLEATGDASILEERLPYFDQAPTGSRTVAEHVDAALTHIEHELVPGTSLIRYGHGDWNDALQPARPELRDRMVSTWTVELLYQSANELGAVLARLDVSESLSKRLILLSEGIRKDFSQYLMPDDVVCGMGFVHEQPLRVEPIIHPSDERTGLRYRLLPMTRGILSGLLSPEEARRHLELIREHLLGVDGARLMDRPPAYRGGMEEIFQRAESASAFSREIGLMYVHAHLRYAEAMARLGEADALFDALLRVTPVGLQDTLEQALPRQANAYFSSSDADVLDRHEASDRYRDLMTGKVGVKGGWRIYSSGPGIYISAVVRSMLGWRETAWGVELDPVLPKRLDGLVYRFNRDGRPVVVCYRVQGDGFGPHAVLVNGQRLADLDRLDHPYRKGGVRLPARVLEGLSNQAVELEVLL